ncbi:MAG: glycoside hydrolase family 2 protein, partial [Mucilaginibacter sp.]
NVYWLAPGNNLTELNNLAPTKVDVKVLGAEKSVAENKWTLQLTNNTNKLAFFVRPQLMANGQEVMPSYWSANYFTLAPHESKTVSVSAPVAKLGGVQPKILVEGWNLEKQWVDLVVRRK